MRAARIALHAVSLRSRLIGCIALVLALSLAVGTAVALRNAARLVGTELRVARDVAARTIRDNLAGVAAEADPLAALRRQIADFDGERHVVVRLLDARGTVLAQSLPRSPSQRVPAWFRDLLAPVLPPLRIAAPAGMIELLAEPRNELAERWSEFLDSLLQLGLFCVLAAGGVLWTTQRALRPLRQLAAALQRIEAGDYTARLQAPGPAEIDGLLQKFNRMAERLAATEAHNRRLHLRLLTLQEEERAELARDLHDEIGPLLFATNVHAATIDALAGQGRIAEVAAHVSAIHDAVGQMQKRVRAILGRLRPLPPTAFGLGGAIERLVAFWRSRHPEIAFATTIELADETLDEAGKETVYRLVQESLTNAVRHGRPGRIEIAIGRDPGGRIRVCVADDGRGGPVPAGDVGFGLAGMRERVAALGGRLAIESGRERGWTVIATLPAAAAESVEPLGLTP